MNKHSYKELKMSGSWRSIDLEHPQTVSRENISRCALSRIKSIETQSSSGTGTNPLDNILNEDAVMRKRQGMERAEELIEVKYRNA